MATTAEKKFLTKILPNMVGGVPGCIRFVLGNGVEVQASLADFKQEILDGLVLHGLSQKVGDSASGFSKARDFHGAFGAMQSVVDGLLAGNWSTRSGGGTSDLVQAIAELQGASLEDAQAAVDKMDEPTLAAVRKHPAIKSKVADIVAAREAERAANSQESLGELLKGIM